MNTIGQNKNIYFSGVISRKLSPQEIKQVKEIENSYYTILDYANSIDTAKFKKRFPGLYNGKRDKGLLLHSGDDQKSPQYHVYKFSPTKPLNIVSTKGKETITCRFDTDTIKITTQNNISESASNKIIDMILNIVAKEIELLKEYSKFYSKIKSQLPLGGVLKSNIIELIKKINTPVNVIKSEIDQLMSDYSNLNVKLNVEFKDVSFKLKEAYFGKNVQKQGKEMTFEHDGKLVFCPLRTGDDRVFRLWKFDNENNLKYAIVAKSDGSIGITKRPEKYQDIRPHNLETISDATIEKLGIKDDLKVLSAKFAEFENFIKEYSSKYRLRKGNVEIKSFEEIEQKKAQEKALKEAHKRENKVKWAEELQERKLLKEQLKQEKIKQKELEKIEKAKAKAEKAQILAEEKQKAKEEAKAKRLEAKAKKLEEKTKNLKVKKEKIVSTNPTEQKIFVAKGLEGVTLFRLAKKIDEIFAKPVEERGAHILHEKLPDGRIFGGKISAIAEDGTKISISRVKSPKYVEFTYYSIKIEQGGISAYLNIEEDGGEIILSTVSGKPILNDNNRIRHISKAQCAKITPMTNEIPQYLKFLLNAE
jgi:hypothetical protein